MYIPTCPLVVYVLKKTKSPVCKLLLSTLVPSPHCPCDVLDKSIPKCEKTYFVNPEQSNAFGPFAPNTYGVPIKSYA